MSGSRFLPDSSLDHSLQEGHAGLTLAYVTTAKPPLYVQLRLPTRWLVSFHPVLCSSGPHFPSEIYYIVVLRQEESESCHAVWKCSLKRKKDSQSSFVFPKFSSRAWEMEDAFRNHRGRSSQAQPVVWGSSSGT